MGDNWIVQKIKSADDKIVQSIAVDDDGNVYFFKIAPGELYKFNSKNDIQRIAEVPGTLRGMVWDGNRTLYITDWQRHLILAYSTESRKITTLAGTGVQGHKDGNLLDATFCHPYGISLNRNGDLLVTDSHRIRKIDLTFGTVKTLAGCTTGRGNGSHQDGDALSSKFNVPVSAVESDDGTLYVADFQNRCIRQIKNDIVSTISGTPGVDGVRNGTLSEALFSQPMSLHWLYHGNLLLCEIGLPLRKIDLTANLVTFLELPGIKNFRSPVVASDGTIFFETPYEYFYKAEPVWKWERYLWIGWLKETVADCFLAGLPSEVIKLIAVYLRPDPARSSIKRKRSANY